MRTLCHQYLSTALTHLLNKPLPWDEWVNSSRPLSLALLIACSYCVAKNFLWEKFSPILPYQWISIFCNASVAGIGEISSSEYFQLHVFNSNNMVMLHVLSICRQMVAMWQVLVSDEGTITQVFQHILEVLSFSLPYQEKTKGNKVIRTETDVPKAVSWDRCTYHEWH